MKTTIAEPESWKRVVTIEVPAEELQGSFDQKMKKYRHDLKLPGFRPGKVPEALIKQRFGASIRAEIIDELIQSSYRDACKEHGIVPVAAPKLINMSSEENEPLVFSIETEVDPAFEVTGYRKLKIKVSPKKIKDADVETALSELRERMATFTDVDRPVKKGDYIMFDYEKVCIDGEERAEISNPTYPVEVGGESGLKDFHKGVAGHVAGETFTVTIKFPRDYEDAATAGKTGEFTIKLKTVQEKVLPEINKEFLEKLGDIADEATLREKIRADLERQEERRAKEEAHNKAIETLIRENDFVVPPGRIEQFIDYMHEEAQKYRRDTPPPDRAAIAEQYRDVAVASIKRQRIIDAIAEKEGIKPTPQEVDAEIARIAGMYRQDFETVKQTLRRNGTTLRIRDEIRERKTLDFLIGAFTPDATPDTPKE